MKNIALSLFVLFIFSFLAIATAQVDAATRVRGYVTKRGTYVAPSYRSAPDRVKYNNYSSKGNFNPYTGKNGYKN